VLGHHVRSLVDWAVGTLLKGVFNHVFSIPKGPYVPCSTPAQAVGL
jgi:hypothetical protein